MQKYIAINITCGCGWCELSFRRGDCDVGHVQGQYDSRTRADPQQIFTRQQRCDEQACSLVLTNDAIST